MYNYIVMGCGREVSLLQPTRKGDSFCMLFLLINYGNPPFEVLPHDVFNW
jgi:hypothetical protein